MRLAAAIELYAAGTSEGVKKAWEKRQRAEKKSRGFLNFVHYDPDTKTMTLTFPGGKKFAYYDVPEKKWENMRYSKKPGSYFYWAVRKRHVSSKLKE